jgi:hypothetical protein
MAIRKAIEPLNINITYDTANALNNLILAQAVHAKREDSQVLLESVAQLSRFHERLIQYIDDNSRRR